MENSDGISFYTGVADSTAEGAMAATAATDLVTGAAVVVSEGRGPAAGVAVRTSTLTRSNVGDPGIRVEGS